MIYYFTKEKFKVFDNTVFHIIEDTIYCKAIFLYTTKKEKLNYSFLHSEFLLLPTEELFDLIGWLFLLCITHA